MYLHAIQEQFGYISPEAMEWTAARSWACSRSTFTNWSPFIPCSGKHPAGKHQIKICRTLSCALGGSHELRDHICQKLGLDPSERGPQTTKDGKFSVEFVECLASCGTAPVVMVNDDFYQGVSTQKADEIVAQCKYHGNKRVWLPDMDLNHDKQIQSLLCYRYTIGQ